MDGAAATAINTVNCPESYILIWLNDRANLLSTQHEMQEELQDTINCQKTFENLDKCHELIRKRNDE